MNVLVNYATREFARYRRLSSETARRFGGFARVLERSSADLDADFRRRHAALLAVPRGGGYWLWKPYVIERALCTLDADDCLFYADAGVFFTGPVDAIAALLRRGGGPLLAFAGSALEREWTKREAFVLLGCDAPRYADTHQALAGISAWRRCAESFEFVAAWRRAVEDARIVGDAPSRCGAPEYLGFRAHRHDTSAFSLLCKQREVALVRAGARREPLPGYAIHAGSEQSLSGFTVIETWRGPCLALHVQETDPPPVRWASDAAGLAGTIAETPDFGRIRGRAGA